VQYDKVRIVIASKYILTIYWLQREIVCHRNKCNNYLFIETARSYHQMENNKIITITQCI
jgi:hypothetical protein